MGKLLTREQARRRLNRRDLNDTDTYPVPYIDALLAGISDDIAQYLQRDLTLHLETNEEGPVEYIASGRWRGRYFLETRCFPLVPGDPAGIFTDLELTYAFAFATALPVVSAFEKVEHDTGQVWCLAPGAVEALSFQYGGGMPGVRATGFVASYYAGYATGNGDPVRGDGTDFGAPALPESVRAAAVLLLREALAVEDSLNADPGNPRAHAKTLERGGDQEDRYGALATKKETATLGYGTELAQAAQIKLARFKHRRHLLAVI